MIDYPRHNFLRWMDGVSLKSAKPNVRIGSDGYRWGREATDSRILGLLKSTGRFDAFRAPDDEVISELWLMIDDELYPETILLNDGSAQTLSRLLQEFGSDIVGVRHLERFGPWLGVAAKIIDTNPNPRLGTLSAQVHPHSAGGAKPETWIGYGDSSKIHVGFNRPLDRETFLSACRDGEIESAMQPAIALPPGSLVHIEGGRPHAIGADSTLIEISVAASRQDPTPLPQRTVSFYDRWFGRASRPGKEKPEAALQLIESAGFLGISSPSPALPQQVHSPSEGVTAARFSLKNEYSCSLISIATSFHLQLDTALLYFVAAGSGFCISSDRKESICHGCYGLIPLCMESVAFAASRSEVLKLVIWQPGAEEI